MKMESLRIGSLLGCLGFSDHQLGTCDMLDQRDNLSQYVALPDASSSFTNEPHQWHLKHDPSTSKGEVSSSSSDENETGRSFPVCAYDSDDNVPLGFYEDLQKAIFEAINKFGNTKADWKPIPKKLRNHGVEIPDVESSSKSIRTAERTAPGVRKELLDSGSEIQPSFVLRRKATKSHHLRKEQLRPVSEIQPSFMLRRKATESHHLRMSQLANTRKVGKMGTTRLPTLMLNMDVVAEETKSQLGREEDMWLFCTLFPENYEFDRDTLDQLWMAREFIDGDTGCFDALLANGFIQVRRICSQSGNTKYTINVEKLNNTITTTLMEEEKRLFLRLRKSSDSVHKAHPGLQHLSLEGVDVDESLFDQIKNFKDLKALLFLCISGWEIHRATKLATNYKIVQIPHSLFSTLKHLQILDLSGICIAEVPSSIGEVTELRYLDLSFSLITDLPETIDCLTRLQTLKLRGCIHLFRLPEGIVKLTKLQHLDLDILGQLSFLPRRMGALTELETLSAFLVDKENGRGINELGLMNNLRGKFCISQLDRVSSPVEAKKAALSDKQHLEKLELRWKSPRSNGSKVQQHEYQVLDHLSPPSNLKHLDISGYGGLKCPDWISDPSLHLLVSITLIKCVNLELLPSLGMLPSLVSLQLIDIPKVKRIGGEFRGQVDAYRAFPVLDKLLLVGMSNLETWEGLQEGDFPRICKLTVERCPKLITMSSLSCLKSLEHLELSRCNKLSSLAGPGQLVADNLKMLIIDKCPSIKKRDLRHNGTIWAKIKDVEEVWIDHEEIITHHTYN